MNIYDFLATYSRLAHDIATKDEIDMAYFELEGLVKNTTIENLFTKSNPNRLDKILSIDSVAHNFHSKNPQLLDDIFPGSDYAVVKHELDKLAGYEVTSDIRKANRGFFTTMLAEEGLFFLEKGIGKVSSNEISTEMEHYEILYEAQLKAPGIDMLSNAELLTLYRYYNDNKYAQMINERGLNKNKPIIVGGYASVIIIDRQGHLITKAALEEAFIGFMKSFRTRNIMIAHCLTPETLISISPINKKNKEYKRIDEIKVGDKVRTSENRLRKVLKVIIHDYKYDINKIHLDNGEIIRVTDEHPILTKRGWVRAGEINNNDILLTEKLLSSNLIPVSNGTHIISITKEWYDGKVYNLEIEEDHTYAGKGIIYHNSDVQVGWPLPVYINEDGEAFKSGVDDKGLYLITEVRPDTQIAEKVRKGVNGGEFKSYSIAGTAMDKRIVTKNDKTYMQVDKLELVEITICSTPVNQDSNFIMIKSFGENVHTRKILENLNINKALATIDEAKKIGDEINVSWDEVDLEEFRRGIQEEKEHIKTVSGNIDTIGQIALDHLKEDPEYYHKLKAVMSKKWENWPVTKGNTAVNDFITYISKQNNTDKSLERTKKYDVIGDSRQSPKYHTGGDKVKDLDEAFNSGKLETAGIEPNLQNSLSNLNLYIKSNGGLIFRPEKYYSKMNKGKSIIELNNFIMNEMSKDDAMKFHRKLSDVTPDKFNPRRFSEEAAESISNKDPKDTPLQNNKTHDTIPYRPQLEEESPTHYRVGYNDIPIPEDEREEPKMAEMGGTKKITNKKILNDEPVKHNSYPNIQNSLDLLKEHLKENNKDKDDKNKKKEKIKITRIDIDLAHDPGNYDWIRQAKEKNNKKNKKED